MTTIERWKNEGYYKGLLEAIDLGLSIRFESHRDTLMSLVKKTQDIEKLKKIKETIRTANSVSELNLLIEQREI